MSIQQAFQLERSARAMYSDKNRKKLVNRKIVTTARRLALEKLQARELLAGDVTAAVTNGFLVVRGDDAANELTIERINGDKVRVTGATGTTINGLTQPAILRVRKGYDIATGGGDDKLTVIGLNAVGRYEIRMDLGAGNDVLVASNLLAQRIHAGGGDGNDSITVRNSRSRRGSGVGGGIGDDTMVLENLRFGNGSCIDGGTGKNTVTQTNNRFGVRFTQINTDPNAPSDVVNVAPVANNDSAGLAVGATTQINVLSNDTDSTGTIDPKTVVIVTQPTAGTASVNSTTGVISYTHNGGSARTDSLTYTVKDDKGLVSNVATVSISITETTPPTAVADSFSVVKGASATVNLANNDTAGTAAINRGSIVITTQPTNGTVTVGTDGNVNYVHNNSSTTSDSFAYTIKDVNGLTSAPASVTVTVTQAPAPPTAVADSFSVVRGASATVNLANNDTAGTAAINRGSIVITTQPANGTVTVGTDGNVNYVHNNSSTTSDSFAYTIKDVNGLVSAAATVSVTITANNQAPVAVNDTATVAEGGTATISILANDTAPTGGFDLASIVFTDLPIRGTIVKNADGTVTYTHSGNESTSDTFRYTVKGTNGVVSNEATVSITITPVNDAPVANNDTASVVEGGSVNIPVLSNDSDIEGNIDPTSVVIVSQPANGTVGVNTQTGVVNYVHNGGPSTSDSFTYSFKDNQGVVSNVATVSITIQRKPIANNDGLTVARGGEETVNLIANDTAPSGTLSPSSIVITTQPANGTITSLGNGQVTYKHNGSNTTSDSFAYTVADSNSNVSVPASVSVTITPVNNPPVTQPDTATVSEGDSVDINVLSNDTVTFDGLDPASVTIVTAPTNGTAIVLSNGSIRYTHSGTESTSDVLFYTVRGNNGLVSSSTRVDITITAVNDGPLAVNDEANVLEGGTVNIPVLANDTDADNAIDTATVVIVNSPSNGTAILGVGGVVQYTHDGTETTVDSFTYRVSDVSGKASNLATVSISITPVNDPPVAVNDAATIPSNIAAIVDLAANDFDNDDGLDLASIAIGTQPSHGTLTVQTDGKVSYVHDGSEATSDVFTYRIRDKSGQLSNEATVSLTITLVNQPPIAVPDSATVSAPGGQVVIDVAGNDSDPDGGLNLGSVVILTQPSHGTALNLGNGSIRYTHDGSDATSDSFTYKIRDFAGELSNEATVTITVSPV
ncbi:MAG: Ig-like domain-containing protein [Planctomycetaceae bacterium]|nr:Ig-like domain-containing protein [Planctomycetaceae bacterium]